MKSNEFLKPVWQVKKLIVCNVIAFCLLVLWAIPVVYQLGMAMDTAFFRWVNGSLAYHPVWAALWGVASMRYFDLLVAMVLGLLLICGTWLYNPNQVRQAFFALVVLMVVQVVIRVIFTKLIHAVDWQHASPSMVVEDAFRLSKHFPEWEQRFELKDRSSRSFPGDHASVLLIWALFLSQFASKFKHYALIWGVAILFMMPRLVAGAHWASDDYIGGLFLALVALGWGLFTPLAAKASRFLVRVTKPLFRLLQKIPLVNRFNIVRYPE